MTSSPSTVMPSIRTHLPTQHLHPTMQFSNQEWERIVASRRIVQRFTQTPKTTIDVY